MTAIFVSGLIVCLEIVARTVTGEVTVMLVDTSTNFGNYNENRVMETMGRWSTRRVNGIKCVVNLST